MGVSDFLQEIRHQFVNKPHHLLDRISVRKLIKHAVSWWGLHDLIPETGEIAVWLVPNDHSVLIQSLDLSTGHILVTFHNNKQKYFFRIRSQSTKSWHKTSLHTQFTQ